MVVMGRAEMIRKRFAHFPSSCLRVIKISAEGLSQARGIDLFRTRKGHLLGRERINIIISACFGICPILHIATLAKRDLRPLSPRFGTVL